MKKEQFVPGWIIILGIFLALIFAFIIVFAHIAFLNETDKSGQQLETASRTAGNPVAPLILLSDLIVVRIFF